MHLIIHLLFQTVLIIFLIAPAGFSATYTIYSDLSSYSQASTTVDTQDFGNGYPTSGLYGINFMTGVNVTSNMNKIETFTEWSGNTKIGLYLFAYDTTGNDPRAQGNAYYQINFDPQYQYRAAAFDIKSLWK